MIDIPSTETLSATTETATTPGPRSRDTIHFLCLLFSSLAWLAIVVWILAPKGSRWASAAADAGLAWLLFTGGGYFAEQTVRSCVDRWKPSPASYDREAACQKKESSPR